MFETYGIRLGERKDVYQEVPDDPEWLRAYKERGWSIVDVEGKQMLKYPAEMGTPLYPHDTTPIILHDEPTGRPKGKKRQRKKW